MTHRLRRAISLICFASAVLLGVVSATAQSAPTADSIVNKMTSEQKIDYIGGTGFAIRAVPDLGLPALEMSDGPVGVRSNLGFPSTTYTAGIALAASWDPELAERVGAGIGKDARARGIHFMLGPGNQHLPFAAQWTQLRVLWRRSVPLGCDGGWVHRGHAEAGCERDGQALHGQQLGVSAP